MKPSIAPSASSVEIDLPRGPSSGFTSGGSLIEIFEKADPAARNNPFSPIRLLSALTEEQPLAVLNENGATEPRAFRRYRFHEVSPHNGQVPP